MSIISGIHPIWARENGKSWNRVIPPPFDFGNAIAWDGVNDFSEVLPMAGRAMPQVASIEFWVYQNATSHNGFFSTNKAVGVKTWVIRSDTSNKILLHFYSDSGGGSTLTSLDAISNNTWNYIAVTYDKTNNLRYIYINGVLSISDTSGYFFPTSLVNFLFGRYFAVGFHVGKVDEIRYYEGRMLTANEVLAHWNNGNGAGPYNTDGLVGYWTCNEMSGTIAYDLSGNGYDMTLVNGASFVAH